MNEQLSVYLVGSEQQLIELDQIELEITEQTITFRNDPQHLELNFEADLPELFEKITQPGETTFVTKADQIDYFKVTLSTPDSELKVVFEDNTDFLEFQIDSPEPLPIEEQEPDQAEVEEQTKLMVTSAVLKSNTSKMCSLELPGFEATITNLGSVSAKELVIYQQFPKEFKPEIWKVTCSDPNGQAQSIKDGILEYHLPSLGPQKSVKLTINSIDKNMVGGNIINRVSAKARNTEATNSAIASYYLQTKSAFDAKIETYPSQIKASSLSGMSSMMGMKQQEQQELKVEYLIEVKSKSDHQHYSGFAELKQTGWEIDFETMDNISEANLEDGKYLSFVTDHLKAEQSASFRLTKHLDSKEIINLDQESIGELELDISNANDLCSASKHYSGSVKLVKISPEDILIKVNHSDPGSLEVGSKSKFEVTFRNQGLITLNQAILGIDLPKAIQAEIEEIPNGSSIEINSENQVRVSLQEFQPSRLSSNLILTLESNQVEAISEFLENYKISLIAQELFEPIILLAPPAPTQVQTKPLITPRPKMRVVKIN